MFINYTRRNNLEHIQTVKLFLEAQLSFYAGKAEMWRHSNCSGIVTQLTDRLFLCLTFSYQTVKIFLHGGGGREQS